MTVALNTNGHVMRLLVSFLALLFVTLSNSAGAQNVFTVTGKDGDVRGYSFEEIEALGVETVRTRTTWTEGEQEFSGPLLSRIAEAHGVVDGTFVIRAINAYEAEVSLEDARRYPVILATRQNGERMPVRDKGPGWIIFPRSTYPELDDDRHNHMWVWQVVAIELR